MAEFPDMKGLSYRNLKYIRQWYQFYNEQLTIWQQAVAKLDDENTLQSETLPHCTAQSSCQSEYGNAQILLEFGRGHLREAETIQVGCKGCR